MSTGRRALENTLCGWTAYAATTVVGTAMLMGGRGEGRLADARAQVDIPMCRPFLGRCGRALRLGCFRMKLQEGGGVRALLTCAWKLRRAGLQQMVDWLIGGWRKVL